MKITKLKKATLKNGKMVLGSYHGGFKLSSFIFKMFLLYHFSTLPLYHFSKLKHFSPPPPLGGVCP
jgi:hypothetical protein